jgi:exodeoxyribonuclease V alpha subunit
MVAPTGKAAARLSEAIREQVHGFDLEEAVRARLPAEVQTIHRLLGYSPWQERFRHDRQNPLACDLLVVDEASMVDLQLMDALLSAAPDEARVILVGDQDQLASVETGSVLGDLCRAVPLDRGHSSALSAACEELLGWSLPCEEDSADLRLHGAFRDAVVRLEVNYRFRERPEIAALAQAIGRGQADRAIEVLEGGWEDTALLGHEGLRDELIDQFGGQLRRILEASSPRAALSRVADFQILCALRQGPWGVSGVTEMVERWMRRRGYGSARGFYKGRPILITANDYQLGLWNGDLGVCWPEEGRMWVWFEDLGAPSALRRLAPAKLPGHATAWAVTVHKSQGSEFEEVLLVLPDRPSRVVTRELVYTAVTRARRRVTVVSEEGLFRGALAERSVRFSGLASRLIEEGP